MRKSQIITISLSRKLAAKVERKAKKDGLARSEIFRTALTRYLSDEEDERLFQTLLRKRASAVGIKSEKGVERLIDSIRQ